MRLFICAVLISGCGGTLGSEIDPDVQENALTCSNPICRGSVTNNFTSLPSENTYFCHPLGMTGTGAHSQAPVLQWGVPAWGANHGLSASTSSPSMAAIPNALHQGSPKQGNASIEVQCDRWTNFQAGTGNGYSSEWTHNWIGATELQLVEAHTLLQDASGTWDTNGVCYFGGFGSLSATPGEKAFLDIPNGLNWQQNTVGFRNLQSTTRCAWLGHAPAWSTSVWLDTGVANPHDSGMAVGAGICLPYHVETTANGSMDDGSWSLNRDTGNWRLMATGLRVKAYCLRY